MRKEEGVVLVQLANALKESVARLEEAYDKKDEKNLEAAKKEILGLQKKIGGLLN